MVSKIKTGSSTGKGENKKGEETATEENKEEKASKKTWKQNRQEKVKFTYKEQREYETIDEDIAKLEEKLASIERQITANATNSVKMCIRDRKYSVRLILTDFVQKLTATELTT